MPPEQTKAAPSPANSTCALAGLVCGLGNVHHNTAGKGHANRCFMAQLVKRKRVTHQSGMVERGTRLHNLGCLYSTRTDSALRTSSQKPIVGPYLAAHSALNVAKDGMNAAALPVRLTAYENSRPRAKLPSGRCAG
jgi:hypothetical protein